MTHRGAVVLMAFCALLWSTAGVMTRFLERAESFEVTFWRSFFCVIGVAAAIAWRARASSSDPNTALGPVAAVVRMGVPGLISGVMWAIMFTCFMVALTRTTVANTLLVSALSPLFAALLAWAVLKEQVRAITWAAIALAGFGIWWMVHEGVSPQGASGMLIALGVPIAAAINLVVLRKLHAQVDFGPAVLLGGLISCIATLPFAWPLAATANDLAILAFLGFFQLALPCVLMIRAAKQLAPQEIALIALLENLLGAAWAWIGAGEALNAATLQGGAIVLAALIGNELLTGQSPEQKSAASPSATQGQSGV